MSTEKTHVRTDKYLTLSQARQIYRLSSVGGSDVEMILVACAPPHQQFVIRAFVIKEDRSDIVVSGIEC